MSYTPEQLAALERALATGEQRVTFGDRTVEYRSIDDLIAAIGAALEADRTLGGLCDWVEPEAPASVDLPVEGAAALKAALITVVLHYTTTGPLA